MIRDHRFSFHLMGERLTEWLHFSIRSIDWRTRQLDAHIHISCFLASSFLRDSLLLLKQHRNRS